MIERYQYNTFAPKSNIIDIIYNFCIALLPVLCLLNVPVLNISFGTVILLVFIPHALVFALMYTIQRDLCIAVFLFFLFYLYLALRADGSLVRVVLCMATFINLWGIVSGSIDSDKIRRTIEVFALINAILILLQVLCYYGFHYKIQYIPQSLIHSSFQDSYVFRENSGLYRPSALFLEPAHYAQYCCFALISALFPNKGKVNVKKTVLIALGCILTTSGMGIMLTFGILAWYFFAKSKGRWLSGIIKLMPAIIIGTIVLLQIPFVQTALQRVFSNVDGYNAITGRTKQWHNAIGPMRKGVLWFGYGDSANYPYYLAGLADTIYKYGLLGALLEFCCFVFLMHKQHKHYVWCCSVVFFLLFCFAHLTSFSVQVFYLGIVAADVSCSINQTQVVVNGRKAYNP